MRFGDTITVYNGTEQDFKRVLCPRVLSGVHAEAAMGAASAADGDKPTDALLVIIPFNGHSNGFLTPLEYERAEDKSNVWTLACGDIITLGDTGAAEGYAELSARTRAYRITQVKALPFGSIPHWEVQAT